MSKVHLNLNVDPEVKRWFKEHGIGASDFFDSAWHQYIESDIDTQAQMLVNRLQTLEGEKERLSQELHKITGKTLEDFIGTGIAVLDMKTKEQQNLARLYGSMNEDQQRVLAGKKSFNVLTMTQVQNWIEARKADFGLMMPSQMIIEKFRNNGGAKA